MNAFTSLALKSRSLCVAACASFAMASAAQADMPAKAGSSKVMLTGYEDAASGKQLLAGEYSVVIAKLAAHGAGFTGHEVEASTNLCVAYIMSREWGEAHGACDEAISYAKLQHRTYMTGERVPHDDAVAAAYSNRAVLNWLEHDMPDAKSDLAQAKSLSPSSEVVVQNLSTLTLKAGYEAPAS